MRNIEMVIEARRHDHWAMKRHRSRLEYFVSVLKQYADDDNQKSLLTYLQIKYERPHSDTWAGNLHYQKQHMYGLESLASLQGIKHVDVEGEHLPDWYAKCLQICINGTGGDVLPIDYPDIKIKKRIPGFHKRYEMVWQTTRAWHHPILNWDEYAERNGVDMPAGGVYVDLTES
jgi:hypothetical protein